MDNNAYVTFLAVGAILVVMDGQIIYHSGKRYLNKGDSEAGGSMTGLVTVLFHLVALGVLALISTIHFSGEDSLPGVIGRLGVLLLVLAIAHGVTIGVLTRMREEQVVENVNTRINAPVDRPVSETMVDPVLPPNGPPSTTAYEVPPTPGIHGRAPYTTER